MPKTDIVQEAQERLEAAWAQDRENREDAFTDLKFLAGDQWPNAIRQQREAQNRPCLTINWLRQFVNQAANTVRMNPPAIKAISGLRRKGNPAIGELTNESVWTGARNEQLPERRPNVAKPRISRDAVRGAWKWVIAYALVQLCFYIYFEWRIAVSGKIHEYAFLTGLVLFFFLVASLYLFIKSLLRREKAAALLYAALFAINLASPRIGMALDQTAKAYFFSAFPEMCPEGSPKPGYRVSLCYKYWEIDSRTALVLNPGDELAAPYTAWPPEFDKEIFENVPVTECRKKKTSLLVNHVYVVEDDCWGVGE